MMCKLKEWTKTLTDVVAMTKKEYVLTIATSLLGGIVIGFVFAPKRTRHTTIGSHNGSDNNNNGNENGNEYPDDFYENWEDADEMENMEDFEDMEEELSFH